MGKGGQVFRREARLRESAPGPGYGLPLRLRWHYDRCTPDSCHLLQCLSQPSRANPGPRARPRLSWIVLRAPPPAYAWSPARLRRVAQSESRGRHCLVCPQWFFLVESLPSYESATSASTSGIFGNPNHALSPLATQGVSSLPRRNPTTLSRPSAEFQRRKAARRSHG
jgi:hypothetical protein